MSTKFTQPIKCTKFTNPKPVNGESKEILPGPVRKKRFYTINVGNKKIKIDGKTGEFIAVIENKKTRKIQWPDRNIENNTKLNFFNSSHAMIDHSTGEHAKGILKKIISKLL